MNGDATKEAIEEASTEEVAAYMKPIDYLSIIGATAPMLGLLGTVSGMIKAFQTIGRSGMGKPEDLAANIGEALVTTATGTPCAAIWRAKPTAPAIGMPRPGRTAKIPA